MDYAVVTENLTVSFGDFPVLKNINLRLPHRSAAALIGPSGCGKTTFLRTLNRMNDRVSTFRVRGRVWVDGVDVYGPHSDPVALRRRVGMVFQRPHPFPLSILDNVTWGLRGMGLKRREMLDRAEDSLRKAGLWDEVKDRLREPAFALSGGQRQRLCIARAIAVQPEVILMDEPTSALDPVSTGVIEELIISLKEEFTVIVVSHDMQQAARVSDWCAFFLKGELVEYGPTAAVFSRPRDPRTEEYVAGRVA